MTAAHSKHAERVLKLLRQRPRTTSSLHSAYILNPSVVIHRLRRAGNILRTERLASGEAKYHLIAAAE